MPPPFAEASLADDRRALESLLSFWSDAGVEALYANAPVNRTEARKAPTRPAPEPVGLHAAPQAAAAPRSHNVEAARQAAAAASDLEALALAARAALAHLTPAPILWRGAADAAVIVIGDAPGADEEIAASPFAGAAGRLLDRMMEAAGLAGRVFILHTLFWRPPGDRSPTAEEFTLCAPFIDRAMALVAPRALLIAGAGAARAMLGRDEPILSLHGRWLEWRSADGALELPALPTLSPAFLLRQPIAKRKSWGDLLTLSERVDRPHRPG